MHPEKPSEELELVPKVVEGEVLPAFKERTEEETIAYARWKINDLRNALGVMQDFSDPRVRQVIDMTLQDIYKALDSKTLIEDRDYHEQRLREMTNVTPPKS